MSGPRDLDEGARADLARGARLFDEGSYFEAHEAWEARWRIAEDAIDRRLFQGLVQIAAAFHKLFVMGSPESAARLLERGLAKLEACPERVHGMDLAALRARLRACAPGLERLERSAAPRIGALGGSPPRRAR